MNRTSPGLSNSSQPNKYSYKKHSISLSVSKAILGFIQFKGAEELSPRTLTGCGHKSVNHSASEYARDDEEMVFMKSMSILWKGSVAYCVPGCGRIGASRKRNCCGI
jgi:hypothetical protein